MDNKLVGQNIRKYRRFRDMSQKELAKAVGYATKSSINKIEAGEASVPISRLTQIANALRVPLQALMENIPDDGMPYEDYSTSEVATTTQVNELSFVADNRIEYDEVRELLRESELSLQRNQKLCKELEHLHKRFRQDMPQLQADKDLVFKFHALNAVHQKTVMDLLNTLYHMDSQAQKNTAQTDGEESNKKTATAK